MHPSRDDLLALRDQCSARGWPLGIVRRTFAKPYYVLFLPTGPRNFFDWATANTAITGMLSLPAVKKVEPTDYHRGQNPYLQPDFDWSDL